jgi:ribosomal protein L3 glutamine methyltransferase
MAAHSAAAIRSQRDDGRVMSELFHTRAARGRAPRGRAPPTVRALIDAGARRLARARVYFGHGTDNARDESAALVLHALQLPHAASGTLYRRRVGAAAAQRARALIARRIRERIPAAYLTGVTGFAGLRFCVDPRVLIPRSPIAELIERGFAPWLEPARVRRVLDLGTGSGCIAIAAARALPRARVDAVDISAAALAVAATNVRRHRLKSRVRLRRSDHFRALRGRTYDIIVSNPPYVGARELARLPPEYRHEPRVALAAGRTGLDSVRVILREAAGHLKPRGLLVVEVGNSEHALRRAFPRLPFVWLAFERGGGGVFLLTREQLTKH